MHLGPSRPFIFEYFKQRNYDLEKAINKKGNEDDAYVLHLKKIRIFSSKLCHSFGGFIFSHQGCKECL